MEILDRDIHLERRRVFWQTAYIAALEKLLGTAAFGAAAIGASAGEHAAEAVRQFDRWETTQAEPARGDEGLRPPGGDAEDAPYLGSGD